MIQAVRVSKLSAVISFFILSFIGLIVFLFSRQFISFFIPSDSAVIDGGSHFIRIVALGFGFIGLHMSFGHVFLAAGKSSTSMTLTLLSQWLIQIPLAYFLSQHTSLGINGLWIALPVTNITIAFIAFLIYKKGSWQKVQII
jgi:Na+-driven multidrug efflux pump